MKDSMKHTETTDEATSKDSPKAHAHNEKAKRALAKVPHVVPPEDGQKQDTKTLKKASIAPDSPTKEASKETKDSAGKKAGTQAADAKKESKGFIAWFKRKNKVAKSFMIAGTVLLVAIIAVALVGWQYLRNIDNKISLDSTTAQQLNQVLVAPESDDEPYYVLIIGSDSRDTSDMGDGRSDTIMLARVDPAKPQVSLISIPRDSKIYLEGHGIQKINAAFQYGGPAGSVQVVSELFNVKISHYVEIDFDGFISIVDQLGGIDVDVPVDIDLWGTHISAGKQHLNGAQALIMSRCRYLPGGDFQRVQDQRIIFQAIAKAVLSSSKFDLPGLITSMASSLKSDLNSTAAINLLLKLQGLDTKNSLYMATVPAHVLNLDNISYVDIEWPRFVIMIEQMRNGLPLDSKTLPPGTQSSGRSALRALAAAFYPDTTQPVDTTTDTSGDNYYYYDPQSSAASTGTTSADTTETTPAPSEDQAKTDENNSGDTSDTTTTGDGTDNTASGDTSGGDASSGDTTGGDTTGGDTTGGGSTGGDTGSSDTGSGTGSGGTGSQPSDSSQPSGG